MATRQKISVEDYLALPEWEKPYREYLDGEVVAKVSPDIRHMRLAYAILRRIGDYAETHAGEVGPEGRIELHGPDGAVYFLVPDVALWAAGRPVEGARAMQPPTLAVEIRSPGQPIESQRARARLYCGNGVDVCWVVDPESRTIEVFAGDGAPEVLDEAGTIKSNALPGLELDVAQLFSVLDR